MIHDPVLFLVLFSAVLSLLTSLRDCPTIYSHIYSTHTQDSMPRFSNSVLLERTLLRCERTWHIPHVLIVAT